MKWTPQADLDKLERAGIPIKMLQWSINKRGSARIAPQTKEKLRDYMEKARGFAKRIRTLRRHVLDANWADGIEPTVVEHMLDSIPGADAWNEIGPEPGRLDKTVRGMEFLEVFLSQQADDIGEYLRHYGRADLSVDFTVGWILRRKKDFQSWEAVASLLPDKIDARDLRRKAARSRKNRQAVQKKER